MMNTTDQVIEFLRQNNDLDGVDIRAESKLIADLGLTSFSVLEMCYYLENTFHIEVDDNDIAGIETVDDIVKYISAKQEKTGEKYEALV